MKTKNNQKTTTIGLTITDNERLTKLCTTLSIKKKDFIPIILSYIEHNGVNPKTDHAPKTELAQINKRIDQVFGFIKTQEMEFFRPMLEAILATEKRLQNQIGQLVVKDDLNNYNNKEEDIQLMENVAHLIIRSIREYRQEVEEKLEHLENKFNNIEEQNSKILEKLNEKKGLFNIRK